MIKKYRKKPIVIEAIQYTGENDLTIERWSCHKVVPCLQDVSMFIHTQEGIIKISVGDFVIKGVQNEFYPCKSDIFKKTYELVVEE